MNVEVTLKTVVSHLIFRPGELHNLVSIFGRLITWFWVEAEPLFFLVVPVTTNFLIAQLEPH